MKSFQEFIIEKNRKDYSRKGGEGGVKGTRITPSDRSDARARIQDTSYSTPSRGQRATPATPSELMSAWKEGGAGKRTVVGTLANQNLEWFLVVIRKLSNSCGT